MCIYLNLPGATIRVISQMALKRPHAIAFSKKNAIHPFEDASSLEFWAQKNDASMFVIGQSTKKRPAGIVIARTFDSRVLDMCELGIDKFVSMSEFKVRFRPFYLQVDDLKSYRRPSPLRGTSPCSTLLPTCSTPTRGTSSSSRC